MAANAAFMPRRRREKHYRGTNPLLMEFSDEQLRQRYRFGRDSINYLAGELRGDLERLTNKGTAISVEQQVMIALRFYASGAQMQVVGDTMGLDKSTVSRVIEDVTNALVDRKDQYIRWPVNVQRLNEIKAGFYQKAHFPNVIGCVDGTHVRIQAPSEDEPSYVNRKGYHSINVQGICDHDGNSSIHYFSNAKKKNVFSLFLVMLSLQCKHPVISHNSLSIKRRRGLKYSPFYYNFFLKYYCTCGKKDNSIVK